MEFGNISFKFVGCHLLWFLAYTMAKYGMSMCVLGMAQEFKDDGIAVNALWPKTGKHETRNYIN